MAVLGLPVVLVTAVGLVAAAAPASAEPKPARVSVDQTDRIRFAAGDGAVNDVIVRQTDAGYEIEDLNGPVNLDPELPGSCRQTTARKVTCGDMINIRIFASLADGDDFFSNLATKLRVEVHSGDGDDTLYGGQREDELRGGPGHDLIYGSSGSDRIYGDDGADKIFGNDGLDFVYGGPGDDDLNGGDDNDTVSGEEGRDVVRGDGGDDAFVDGGPGKDHLRGGDGDDSLYSIDDEDDLLHGDAGDDTFVTSGRGDFYGDSGRTRCTTGTSTAG